LIAALGSDFYADAEAARRALAQKSSFNVVHLSSGVKVGVFVLGDGAFDRSEFDRAEQTRLRGEENVLVRVKTAEDIILRKLQWCRLAGEVSDRQWGDVVGCLEAGRRDVGYLRHWARELEVSDLLELALSQASTV
jgi:hypothetical protein